MKNDCPEDNEYGDKRISNGFVAHNKRSQGHKVTVLD